MIYRLLHPYLAVMLFVIGILIASLLHPLFGIVFTIMGGLLLGFSIEAENLTSNNRKENRLFHSFYFFCLYVHTVCCGNKVLFIIFAENLFLREKMNT